MRRFPKKLGGGQTFQTPRLMLRINGGDYFLITEVVTNNRLVKLIYRGGAFKITISKNDLFSEAVAL